MKKAIHHSALCILAAFILALAGCAGNQESTQQNANQQNASSAPASSANTNSAQPQPATPDAASGRTGTITATPNPIQVCDGTTLGETNISWTAAGVTSVEIRVGAPNGELFIKPDQLNGSKKTGKWAQDMMVFYLQDVSENRPLTAANTLAAIKVNVTKEGCPK